MSWKQLLAQHKVHLHRTSNEELDQLRALIDRDLNDAALSGLSADRRFATAYNAALQTALLLVLGTAWQASLGTIGCILKQLGLRSDQAPTVFWITSKQADVSAMLLTMTNAFVTTDTEAEEILTEAKAFSAFVEHWISLEHPSLAKIAP